MAGRDRWPEVRPPAVKREREKSSVTCVCVFSNIRNKKMQIYTNLVLEKLEGLKLGKKENHGVGITVGWRDQT